MKRRILMRTTAMALMWCMASLPAICLAAEPSGTQTVKGSEHSDVLVNPYGKTELQMTVVTPEGALEPGKEYDIRVEISNPTGYIEIVYMPGLTVEPVFSPDKKEGLHPDEYGPPLMFARSSARDERLNFVVLMGDDSYVRTYRWTPPDEGQVTFRAVYLNTKNGEEIGVKTWTGELRSQSKSLRISNQKKAEQGAPAGADKPRR
jgi:hypothetical protein